MFYEDGLSQKPTVNQEDSKANIRKNNANELLRQIEDKKRRDEEMKQREIAEDQALEQKVRDDLKRMNQNFISELSDDNNGSRSQAQQQQKSFDNSLNQSERKLSKRNDGEQSKQQSYRK